jgi:signal transduction histidine kinase
MDTKSKNLIKIASFLVLLITSGMASLILLTDISGEISLFRRSDKEYYKQLNDAYIKLADALQKRNEDVNFNKNICYYAQDGDFVIANIDYSGNNQYKIYISYDPLISNTLRASSSAVLQNYRLRNARVSSRAVVAYPEAKAGDKIFVAYDNAFAEQTRRQLSNTIGVFVLMCVLSLFALVCLIWKSSGKSAIDRLWNEAVLLLIFLISFAWVALHSYVYTYDISNFPPWVIVTISGVFCLINTGLLLIFVRNIKNKRLIKGTLIYAIWAFIKRIFTETTRLVPLNIKLSMAIFAGLASALVTGAIFAGNGILLLFLLLIGAGVVLWLILKHIMRPYDEEVKARLEKEIEAKMKSERLKTELITNVSHDLKTPLTAILNYSDLLLKSDPENEYAKTINEKAHRLRALTENLFDVSKAQSGNIEVNIETLNLTELIDQTLAELDEHSVDFKINLNEKALKADGTLMSRVFGNLAENITKYSLPGTRAYIDSYKKDGKTVITFKNIANYEMNFNSDEIAERFKRGDASRSAAGNGLGLAIAKSYTEACGGGFDIEIDGDLFKVVILI